MKRFFALKNKDAADVYIAALKKAGYGEAGKLDDADFLIFDYERGSGNKRDVLEKYLESHPGFIYPHTPASCFIWDGPYDPLPVRCNFVAGVGQKLSMESYYYPYRIEYTGFPRCKVREFTRTIGRDLLFVPARVRRDGGYASMEYKNATLAAFLFILKNRESFDKITICHTATLQTIGFGEYENKAKNLGIIFCKTDPYRDPNPLSSMIERIESADIIISCETVGYVSVAMGKPTIFYNANEVPATLRGYAQHYENYRSIFAFPLSLHDLTIQEIMNVGLAPNYFVEEWKKMNIGGDFDEDKFISVIREYV